MTKKTSSYTINTMEKATSLALSNTELSAILDSTDTGILMIGKDLIVKIANRRWGEIFNMEPGKLTGLSIREVTGKKIKYMFKDPEGFERQAERLYGHPEEITRDELEMAGANPRVLERFSGPVRDDKGEILGRVEIYRDATKEREIDRLKTNIISIVSHEFRTPLTSIKGYVEEVLAEKTGPLNPKQKDFLNEVLQGTGQLIYLVNKFLNLSRIEAGQIAAEKDRVDLGKLIQQAKVSFQKKAEEQSIDLRVSLPEDLPVVYAEAGGIQEVITNLIDNAIKYTPSGGNVTVNVRVSGEEVLIEVSDTGVGIDVSEQGKVFEPFYRSGEARSRKVGGTGLGLAIARDILEKHRTALKLDSRPGKGSTFSFSLPVYKEYLKFLAHLDYRLDQAKQNQSILAFIILKIVNLEEIKRAYGTDVCSELFVKVRRDIEKVVRKGDLVGQYKEGLIALLGQTDPPGLRRLLERIRQDVTIQTVPMHGTDSVDVKLACGNAFYPQDGTSREELLTRAEEVLREASKNLNS